MGKTPSLLAAAFAAIAVSAGGAAAQSGAAAAPCPLAAVGDSARGDSAAADVVIIASVSAQEVRFNREPRGSVRVLGCDGSGLKVLERRNLPERVQPGVTYRDVFVSVRILGTLDAACIAALAGDTTAARGTDAGRCVTVRGAPAPSAPAPRPPG